MADLAVTARALLEERTDGPSRGVLLGFYAELERIAQERLTSDAVRGEYLHSECSEASAEVQPQEAT